MKTIFVSSTFRDMQSERDILKSTVQPMLNDIARKYGESISFSDLRWGVDTSEMSEEEQNKQVLSVCLDEIDRSRPYMLVLLGERYGFMPGSDMIEREAGKRPALKLSDLDISVTQLEIEYGALSSKESLDHTYFYFRELDADSLPQGFKETDPEYVKRLEDLKTRIKSLAGDHVRFYKAKWNGSSVEGLDDFAEMVKRDLEDEFIPLWEKISRLGIVEKTDEIQDAYIKERSLSFVKEAQRGGSSKAEDLMELNKIYSNGFVRDTLPYYAKYSKGFNTKGLAGWMNATRQLAGWHRIAASRLAQHEIVVHGHKYPAVVIQGEKGSGKTLSSIHICGILRKIGFKVIEIHAGSTSLLSDSLGILLYTIYHVEKIMGLEHRYFKEDTFDAQDILSTVQIGDALEYMTKLSEDFSSKPFLYAKGRIAVVIDGIENIKNDVYKEQLAFVSEHITDQFRVLLTADSSFNIPPTEYVMKFSNTKQDEMLSIIDGALDFYGKQFGMDVKKALLSKKMSSNPLYLFLAVSRLNLMDAEDFRIISETGDGIEAINKHLMSLIDSFPNDLEDMSVLLMKAAAEKIDPLVYKAAEYIGVSRNGLRADDLISILNNKGANIGQLKLVQFINFMSDLFLIRENGSYDFMHSCLREGILKDISDTKELHKDISSYLEKLEDTDPIKKSEYLYQSLEGNRFKESIECIDHNSASDPSIIGETCADWFKTASMSDIESFFAVIKASDESIIHNVTDFIIDRIFEALGDKKTDEDAAAILGIHLKDLVLDERSDLFSDSSKAELLLKIGSRNCGTPNRAVLHNGFYDLYKAFQLAADDKQKLRALTGMLEAADISDEDELYDILMPYDSEYDELLTRVGADTAESGRIVAKAYQISGKSLIINGSRSKLLEALVVLHKSDAVYEALRKSDVSKNDDTYELIETMLLEAKACHELGDKENMKKAAEYYARACDISKLMRDRYKDAKGRSAYMRSYYQKSTFEFESLSHKWGLFSYLKQDDAKYGINDSINEAIRLQNELGTDKAIYELFEIEHDYGKAQYEYRNYDVGVQTLERSLKILNRLKDTVPFYDRLCSCLLCEIGRCGLEAYSEKEKLQASFDSIIKGCKLGDPLADSKHLSDQIQDARNHVLLSEFYNMTTVQKNHERADEILDFCVDIFRFNAEKKDTPRAWVELGKTCRLHGFIAEKLGDRGRAYEYYKETKDISMMLKEKGFDLYTDEFVGIDLLLAGKKK